MPTSSIWRHLLAGIDTPSLIGVWNTAPYFHDGSAATLDDVFRIAGGAVPQAETGTVSNGAGVVTQWVELNNDDTVHGRAYVEMGTSGARMRFANVDGGSAGIGALKVRCSPGYSVQTLAVSVNGVTQNMSLPLLGNDPGWRHTNWGWVRAEGLLWTAGVTNTVELSTPGAFPNVSIDDILISTADDLAAAAPHRRALLLPDGDRTALLAYLRQLDGQDGDLPAATATPTATPTPTPTCAFDVDGSGPPADPATDIVYLARCLLGLPPVPATFRLLDPAIPTDSDIEARCAALFETLDVDADGTADAAATSCILRATCWVSTPCPEATAFSPRESPTTRRSPPESSRSARSLGPARRVVTTSGTKQYGGLTRRLSRCTVRVYRPL